MTNLNMQAVAGTNNEDVIGRLLWYTITSEISITLDDLTRAFDAAGVDHRYLPRAISPRDAFRRATKAAEVNRAKLAPGKYLNILVREVKQTGKAIVRQMVREVVDSENVRLEYTPIANLKLDGDVYGKDMLESFTYPEEDVAMLRVENAYNLCQERYSDRHVREMIANIMRGMNPVNMRPSGGVYFVPEMHKDTMRAMGDMLGYISDKNKFFAMEVINRPEHKAEVAECFEEQTIKDCERLISDMAELLKSDRKVTQKAAVGYMEEIKRLKENADKYEETLQFEILKCRSSMEIAGEQAFKLLEHVEVA